MLQDKPLQCFLAFRRWYHDVAGKIQKLLEATERWCEGGLGQGPAGCRDWPLFTREEDWLAVKRAAGPLTDRALLEAPFSHLSEKSRFSLLDLLTEQFECANLLVSDDLRDRTSQATVAWRWRAVIRRLRKKLKRLVWKSFRDRPPTPRWESETRTLWYRGEKLHHYVSRLKAKNQIRLIEDFDRAEWAPAIWSSLEFPTVQLTIRDLNKTLKIKAIVFDTDRDGRITWQALKVSSTA
jgi:hypothetical protein